MATATITILQFAPDSSDALSQLYMLFSLVASSALFLYAFRLGFEFWNYD